MGHLSLIDYGVVVAYLAVTLVIGFWVSAQIRTGNDYFLAGRTIPWWAAGLSLVATDISSTDIIGLGSQGHQHGLVVANFDWIGCIPAMIVGAFVFIPWLWRSGVTTLPELLERRFDVNVRTAVSLCWVVFMACNLGVMLIAAARAMNGLAGWDPSSTIVLTAALVALYTWSGGLAAVVYTDVFQGIILIVGGLLLVVFGVMHAGGIEPLWNRIEVAHEARLKLQERADANLPADDPAATPARRQRRTAVRDLFSLTLPVDTPTPYPWPAILFGLVMITSPAYWIGNQCIVQRALGARSEGEARAAYVWGAVLKNFIPLVCVVPGMIAVALIPPEQLSGGHPRGIPSQAALDQAIPLLVGKLLPVGLRGLFLAAFLAALMSSIDSYLNSATTLFTHDFYLRFFRPDADERRVLSVGRATTIGLSLWAVCFALVMKNFDNTGVYELFQTFMAIFQGPAFAVLMLGLLTRGTTANGALCGYLGGVLVAMLLNIFNHPSWCEMMHSPPLFQIPNPYLYITFWSFWSTVLLAGAVSYLTPADPAAKLAWALGSRPRR